MRSSSRLPAGPQGAELPLLGSVPKEKAGAEGAGGPRRGPLTCFLSPHPTAGSSGGAGGVPAGGEPPAPSRPARPWAGAGGGGFPNTGLSLLPPAPGPHPRPAPPRSCWRFPLGCGARAPSSLITKQNYFKVPCLPGAGVGGK